MWKKIISVVAVCLVLGLIIFCIRCNNKEVVFADRKNVHISEKKEKELDYDFIDYTLVSNEDKTFNVVEDLLNNPTDYVNKTFKIKGDFVQTTDEITGLTYCGCMLTHPDSHDRYIIEFTPLKSELYHLPQINTEVTIIGRFDVYNVKTQLYYNVNDAIIVKE